MRHPPTPARRGTHVNDTHSSCGATGPAGGATNGLPTDPPASRNHTDPGARDEPTPRRKARRTVGFPMPRPLPWPTILGRAWPGTLIACWTALTTCVILQPRWSTLAIVGSLLVLASLVVRLPLSVVPRPPLWIVSGFVGGCIGAWLGNGLELFLRASTVAVVILWGSALIAWVTPTAELAGSLRFFLRPLRFLGAPVDQWSLVMASALRGLPMLRDQAQAVLDTAKLRLGQDVATLSLRGYARLSVDVITAILSATSRGAAETGRAMSMRGAISVDGGSLDGGRVRLGWVDVCVIAATLLGVAGVVACRLMS